MAALESVVGCGLQPEFSTEGGRVTMGAWRIGMSEVDMGNEATGLAPCATYVKLRGTVMGPNPEGITDFGDLLIMGLFDRPESDKDAPDYQRHPYVMVDMIAKAHLPLIRSDLKLATHHEFERTATESDGSTTVTSFLAQQHTGGEVFPSYSETLSTATSESSRFTANDFDHVIEAAAEKVRPIVAKAVWESQFAEAFNQGRELPGVPKSPVEVSEADAGRVNPLRVIVRYAGAQMLAELNENDQVVEAFMNPKIRAWAAALQAVKTDNFEDQDATRNRVQWAADYAGAFQQEVNRQLGQAQTLIRMHVEQKLGAFHHLAERAEAFAGEVLSSALVGKNYDGAVWRKVASPTMRDPKLA